MTSKDKLIEFLKSAFLRYQEENWGSEYKVITPKTIYYFNEDGSFQSSF